MLFQCYRYMFFAFFLDSSRQLQHQSNAAGPLSVSVVAEQRRLFGHGSHAKRPRSSNSLSKSKRGATCTLKFVCLASKEEEDRPPLSVKERTALANAGLGDASITFGINKSSVYNGIIERFPKLSEVGGFDLMLFQRGTGCHRESGYLTLYCRLLVVVLHLSIRPIGSVHNRDNLIRSR